MKTTKRIGLMLIAAYCAACSDDGASRPNKPDPGREFHFTSITEDGYPVSGSCAVWITAGISADPEHLGRDEYSLYQSAMSVVPRHLGIEQVEGPDATVDASMGAYMTRTAESESGTAGLTFDVSCDIHRS